MKAKPAQQGAGSIRERVRSDGTSYFQARWWDTDASGSVQRSESFPSRDKAEDHLVKVARRKRDQTYRTPSMMTVSDLVREYIDRFAGRGIAPSTIRTNRNRAKTMIDRSIGKLRLESLTTLDVQRWIDALNRSDYKASTIGSAITLLNGALKDAVTLGTIDRHLGAGIRRPSGRKSKPFTTWREDEIKRVLDTIHPHPIYGALYQVALATGMRPGELRALQWDDVNLTSGSIHVRRTIARAESGPDRSSARTKTSAGRPIAIAPEIVDVLKWHRRMQRERRLAHEDWHDLTIVFDRGNGRWLNASSWHKAHTRLCAKAGATRIRLHDLRHTFATISLARNIHPKIVSDILGHASIRITLDLYTHVDPSMQRSALESMADLFVRRA